MWMSLLNSGMTACFDTWLYPLRALPDWLQIGVTAIVVALWMLLAFQVCRTRPIRIRVRAPGWVAIHPIGPAPGEQDPGNPQRSRARQLLNTLRHFGLPLLPFLVLCLPVALVVAQIESHFGWRAAHPGEPLILGASLATETSGGPAISKRELELDVPAGVVEVGAPPLRLDDEATIVWRVSANAPGTYPIQIRLDDAEVEFEVVVGETRSALSAQYFRSGDWHTLAFPVSKPLKRNSNFRVVTIDYQRRSDELFGFSEASWLLLGFAFVIAFGSRHLMDWRRPRKTP